MVVTNPNKPTLNKFLEESFATIVYNQLVQDTYTANLYNKLILESCKN